MKAGVKEVVVPKRSWAGEVSGPSELRTGWHSVDLRVILDVFCPIVRPSYGARVPKTGIVRGEVRCNPLWYGGLDLRWMSVGWRVR